MVLSHVNNLDAAFLYFLKMHFLQEMHFLVGDVVSMSPYSANTPQFLFTLGTPVSLTTSLSRTFRGIETLEKVQKAFGVYCL